MSEGDVNGIPFPSCKWDYTPPPLPLGEFHLLLVKHFLSASPQRYTELIEENGLFPCCSWGIELGTLEPGRPEVQGSQHFASSYLPPELLTLRVM